MFDNALAIVLNYRSKKIKCWGFPGGTGGKEPTCHAGDIRDSSLIAGSGRSLEEGMAAHSNIHAQRIPQTEEPCGLQPVGHTEWDMTEVT